MVACSCTMGLFSPTSRAPPPANHFRGQPTGRSGISTQHHCPKKVWPKGLLPSDNGASQRIAKKPDYQRHFLTAVMRKQRPHHLSAAPLNNRLCFRPASLTQSLFVVVFSAVLVQTLSPHNHMRKGPSLLLPHRAKLATYRKEGWAMDLHPLQKTQDETDLCRGPTSRESDYRVRDS